MPLGTKIHTNYIIKLICKKVKILCIFLIIIHYKKRFLCSLAKKRLHYLFNLFFQKVLIYFHRLVENIRLYRLRIVQKILRHCRYLLFLWDQEHYCDDLVLSRVYTLFYLICRSYLLYIPLLSKAKTRENRSPLFL